MPLLAGPLLKLLLLSDAVFLLLRCSCYSSPIKRARRFAELAWAGRTEPLIYLDTLKEAHLGWLQGMSQGAQVKMDTSCKYRKDLSTLQALRGTTMNLRSLGLPPGQTMQRSTVGDSLARVLGGWCSLGF
jgi:broad specificity phosphatase PhoE